MRILVTVKFTPDLQSQRSFTDGSVMRTADDGSMNELDENAVEAALRLVEAAGEGEVYALTVGGPDAVAAVRKALQLGANHAIHVSDDEIAGADVFGTAKVLAAAIRKVHDEQPLDLVITGMAALDGLTSMLPTALAADLDWAQLTLASDLKVADGVATIVRHMPDAHETVSAPLPAVVSVTDEANSPRYPNFKLIMAARKAPVTQWTLADIGVDGVTVGAIASRVEVVEAVPRPPKEDRQVLTDTGDGGVVLANFLIEKGLA
ncbi:electron transfer flavoprotein subunit beta/FixA family protein [Demequina capsici]|uniref:Electron transfer flavoprotein subunit beta n=1 Tax=Demequina capsici TaxID=3075620 RepID=A0AA96FBD6_9MICO|nr:electron transfer flavoprotein subunit beta/FixA family protein [Demequina sp. PMTSA13]WNM26603.1 electron transfer flavoprotein subunit beta/FixA family protein [Demequina sp. PMTSA13]